MDEKKAALGRRPGGQDTDTTARGELVSSDLYDSIGAAFCQLALLDREREIIEALERIELALLEIGGGA